MTPAYILDVCRLKPLTVEAYSEFRIPDEILPSLASSPRSFLNRHCDVNKISNSLTHHWAKSCQLKRTISDLFCMIRYTRSKKRSSLPLPRKPLRAAPVNPWQAITGKLAAHTSRKPVACCQKRSYGGEEGGSCQNGLHTVNKWPANCSTWPARHQNTLADPQQSVSNHSGTTKEEDYPPHASTLPPPLRFPLPSPCPRCR